jgi:tungstate transport system substrate-binding protein
MTDRSTWIVARKEKPDLKLVVLFEGDPLLINQYHALTINPKLFPDANYEPAKKFVDFLKSDQGQKIIATFGKEKFGEPLYFSVAQKPEN